MDRNFEIGSMVEVMYEGRMYDLHNDFDAVAMTHDIASNSFEIVWHRSFIPSTADCEWVRLRFTCLSSLVVRGIDTEVPRREDARLAFIGYVRADDDRMDGFLPVEFSDSTCHIIIAFEGGFSVKVFGSEANMSIE